MSLITLIMFLYLCFSRGASSSVAVHPGSIDSRLSAETINLHSGEKNKSFQEEKEKKNKILEVLTWVKQRQGTKFQAHFYTNSKNFQVLLYTPYISRV